MSASTGPPTPSEAGDDPVDVPDLAEEGRGMRGWLTFGAVTAAILAAWRLAIWLGLWPPAPPAGLR